MPDVLTPTQRHLNMSHIRSVNTKPELVLRHALWRLGLRYRINDKRLPGKPDIVLPKFKTVVFVNGCFWHGHDGCSKFHFPDNNAEFWRDKILGNKLRDSQRKTALEASGWRVLIVWECELNKTKFEDTLCNLIETIKAGMA